MLRTILCLIAVWQSSVATAYDTFPYRLRHRRSVFCGSLLATTRTLGTLNNVDRAQDVFREFRENSLKARPTLADQPQPGLIRRSSSPMISTADLARRVYGVERAFQKPQSADDLVVGSIVLTGEKAVRQLSNFLETAESAIVNQEMIYRNLVDRHGTTAQWFAYGFEYTWIGISTSVKCGLLAGMNLTLATVPGVQSKVSSLTFLTALAAAGILDLPVRYVQSHEFGRAKLTRALARFEKSEAWLYWSKDMIVSSEFVTELLQENPVRWDQSIREEDYRELRSGWWRFRHDRARLKQGLRNVRFSVDVLVRRDPAPVVSLVLRTQPLPMVESKTSTNDVINAVPAARF